MSSIRQIRTALAENLEAVPALTAYLGDYQTSPYPLSAPKPPVIEVANFTVTYHQSMGQVNEGFKWMGCVVRAYLALASDKGAQIKADEFFEEDVLADAIENLEVDPTLGGLVSGIVVERADQRFWDHPTMTSIIIGGEWQVRMLV